MLRHDFIKQMNKATDCIESGYTEYSCLAIANGARDGFNAHDSVRNMYDDMMRPDWASRRDAWIDDMGFCSNSETPVYGDERKRLRLMLMEFFYEMVLTDDELLGAL